MSRDVPGAMQRWVLRLPMRSRELPVSLNFRRWVRIEDAFANPAGLRAEYAQAARHLGIGGFVLDLDGPAHTAERDLIASVLAQAQQGHEAGLAAMRAHVLSALGGTADPAPLDLAEVIAEALARWTAVFMGLAESSTPAIRRVGTAVVSRVYENPGFPGCPYDAAKGDDARRDCNALRAIVEQQLKSASPAGSVLAALRAAAGRPGDERGDEWIVRNVLGLVGGAVEVARRQALAIADRALREPRHWEFVHRITVPATADEPVDLRRRRLLHEMHGLVSFTPGSALLTRMDAKGRPVLLSLWDHSRHDEYRMPPDVNPVFGVAPHVCLGQHHALEALTHLLFPLFAFAQGGYASPPDWKVRVSGRPAVLD